MRAFSYAPESLGNKVSRQESGGDRLLVAASFRAHVSFLSVLDNRRQRQDENPRFFFWHAVSEGRVKGVLISGARHGRQI
jgi:hypothetical protein